MRPNFMMVSRLGTDTDGPISAGSNAPKPITRSSRSQSSSPNGRAVAAAVWPADCVLESWVESLTGVLDMHPPATMTSAMASQGARIRALHVMEQP